MAFPDTVLGITAELALGADLTALPSTWVWTDVTAYVFNRGSVTIAHGSADGVPQAPPSTITFVADNRDGSWVASNPTGQWFGQLGIGTPVRFTVDEGTASVRMTGFVAALPPRWDASGNDRNVPVTAAGITRRLGRGSAPLRSALVRTISGTTTPPKAYWPCEDASGSTSLAEFFGGPPMKIITNVGGGDVTLADDGPDGSLPLIELTTNAGLDGTVPVHTATGAWTVAQVINIPTAIAGDTIIMRWTTSGTLPMWQLVLRTGSPDTITLEAYDTAGAIQINEPSSFLIGDTTSEAYGVWLAIWVRVVEDGADLDFELSWVTVSATSSFSSTETGAKAGTVRKLGAPSSFRLDGVHMGHLAAWDVDTAPLIYTVALHGYTGEPAHDRASRFGQESGVGVLISGPIDSNYMGPQPVVAFLTALRECETVNDGRLLEVRDPTALDAYLQLVMNDEIVNQDPVMVLTYATHVVPPFEPTEDDQQIRNDVTATRPGGGERRVVKDSGKLTPALIGAFTDSVTTNVETDDDLLHQAGWRVNLGTVEGLRYPQIILNLARNPALIPDWILCEVGSRITIATPPAGIPTDLIDVIIEGWTETFSAKTWTVTLNCSPFAPYKVFEIGDTTADANEYAGRMMSDTAKIRAAISSSATSIVVDPNRTRFTTVADDFNPDLDFRLGGEVVSVSSIATTAGTYVAAGAGSHADNAAVTPALYAGHTTGDLICVLGAIRSSGVGTVSITAGYTRLPIFNTADNVQLWVKVHDGSESDPTVTPAGGSAGDTVSAFTFGLRGMPTTLTDLADLIVEDPAVLLNASGTTVPYGGLWPRLQEGCILLSLVWKADDSNITPVAGFTEAQDASSTTGNDQTIEAAYQIQTTPVLVPEGAMASTGAAAISRSAIVALAAGYQTLTVSARAVNGATKAQAAATAIEPEDSLVLAL
jgi:hypothetical protein